MEIHGINWKIKAVGDRALLVEFPQEISEPVNRAVMDLAGRLAGSAALDVAGGASTGSGASTGGGASAGGGAGASGEPGISGIIETVPAFASLLVYYDPLKLDYREAAEVVGRIAGKASGSATAGSADPMAGRLVEIPVCYGGRFGEDLPWVAEHAGISQEEVVRIHSGREYRIYMLGFLPAFPYLGGMDKRIATPRLTSPRLLIPAGSVGIGGDQTGVYPMESPGGWQLIGRTPLTLFDREHGQAAPYRAGDRIRFIPITEEAFEEIAGEGPGKEGVQTWP